jgi:hypothetical protein
MEATDGDCDNEQVNQRVVEAILPPQSIKEIEASNMRAYIEYGRFFKSQEDCEYFNMLPLSQKQKREVILRIIDLNPTK